MEPTRDEEVEELEPGYELEADDEFDSEDDDDDLGSDVIEFTDCEFDQTIVDPTCFSVEALENEPKTLSHAQMCEIIKKAVAAHELEQKKINESEVSAAIAKLEGVVLNEKSEEASKEIVHGGVTAEPEGGDANEKVELK